MTLDTDQLFDPYTGQPWDPDQAAARGAALLDRLPEWDGWRQLIDVGQLDMSDGIYRGRSECLACIGAQLDYHRLVADQADSVQASHQVEGEYAMFLHSLLGDHAWASWGYGRDFSVHYGFNVPDGVYSSEAAAFELLTAAWQQLLDAGQPA